MVLPSILSDKISKSKNAFQRGCLSIFVIIGERGLKLYRSESSRDQHYRTQRELCDKGLAPFVDDCVDCVDADGETWYGYWTGIADVAGCVHRSDFSKCTICKPPNGFADRTAMKKLRDKEELHEKLRDAGYNWIDGHPGNWGYINGRPVVIDPDL